MPKRQDAAQIIQGGVRKTSGELVATKHELKELVENSPHRVLFIATSKFPPQQGFTTLVSDLKIGQQLTIVGPDPAIDRDWYAKVERKSTGQLRVT